MAFSVRKCLQGLTLCPETAAEKTGFRDPVLLKTRSTFLFYVDSTIPSLIGPCSLMFHFRNLKIGAKIYGIVAILAVVSAGIGAIGLYAMHAFERKAEEMKLSATPVASARLSSAASICTGIMPASDAMRAVAAL